MIDFMVCVLARNQKSYAKEKQHTIDFCKIYMLSYLWKNKTGQGRIDEWFNWFVYGLIDQIFFIIVLIDFSLLSKIHKGIKLHLFLAVLKHNLQKTLRKMINISRSSADNQFYGLCLGYFSFFFAFVTISI